MRATILGTMCWTTCTYCLSFLAVFNLFALHRQCRAVGRPQSTSSWSHRATRPPRQSASCCPTRPSSSAARSRLVWHPLPHPRNCSSICQHCSLLRRLRQWRHAWRTERWRHRVWRHSSDVTRRRWSSRRWTTRRRSSRTCWRRTTRSRSSSRRGHRVTLSYDTKRVKKPCSIRRLEKVANGFEEIHEKKLLKKLKKRRRKR